MSTTTLVVLADPANGEEALGRVFNALAAAYDFDARKQAVQVVFQGAGTRWPALLNDAQHPAHALFKAVGHRIAGASLACATVFGAKSSVEGAGLSYLSSNAVPETPGLASIAEFSAAGPVITF